MKTLLLCNCFFKSFFVHAKKTMAQQNRQESSSHTVPQTPINAKNLIFWCINEKSRKSSNNNNPQRSQSLHATNHRDDIEDSYHSQSSVDSPIPSVNTPHSNSLRMSFKSLMGKKSNKNTKLSITSSYEDSVNSIHSVDENIFQAEFPFEIGVIQAIQYS